MRDSTGQNQPSSPPISASVNVNTAVEVPDLNGSASSTSLAISKPLAPSGGIQTLLDKAMDEGLGILQSPRVRMQDLSIYNSI